MSISEPDYAQPSSHLDSDQGSSKLPRVLVVVTLLAALATAGIVWQRLNASVIRAHAAIELQAMTIRLGRVAIEAEYSNFGEAERLAGSVFDDMVAYGISHGGLPENFASVMRARNEVIAGLALQKPEVVETVVALFYRLQLPAGTPAGALSIEAAIQAGAGLEPPSRALPPLPLSDSAESDPEGSGTGTGPDTLAVAGGF